MLVNNKTNTRLNVENWHDARKRGLLTVETRNNLRSTSVQTYTFSSTG
jgi:hypothetical protein